MGLLAVIDICMAQESNINSFKQFYLKGHALLGQDNKGYSAWPHENPPNALARS